MSRSYILAYFLVIVFGLISRFLFLDHLPVGLVHDESVYAAQAKSIALTGTTLDKQQSWRSLQPVHPYYAELPATVMAPAFWLSDRPLLASHGMSAFLGVLLPLVMAWLTFGIWRSLKLSLLVAVVTLANPLLWQFSRLSYDALFSVFFYLLAAAVLVNNQGWWRLLSLPFFVVGFFQYQGLKLVLIPFVIGILLLQILEQQPLTNFSLLKWWRSFKKKYWSELPAFLAVVSFAVLLTVYYGLVMLPAQDLEGRTSKVIFKDDSLAQIVDTRRRLSLDSPLTSIMTNKPSETALFMISRASRAFSPSLLFVTGEVPISLFAVTTHGIFYLVDFGLILLGGYALLKDRSRRGQLLVILGMILILALPTYINTQSEWHLLRTQLSYTMIIFLIGWGWWKLTSFRALFLVVAAIYLISILNFSYQYFYRYPLTSADRANIAERVIAAYINLVKEANPGQEIWIYTRAPEHLFYNYLVFSNSINQSTVDQIASELSKIRKNKALELSLAGVTFSNGCVPAFTPAHQTHLFDQHFPTCFEEERFDDEQSSIEVNTQTISVPVVSDSGERYRIRGDSLCDLDEMPFFPNIKSRNQLKIEQMGARELCQTWLMDLSKVH